jgi:hypothetical protein
MGHKASITGGGEFTVGMILRGAARGTARTPLALSHPALAAVQRVDTQNLRV